MALTETLLLKNYDAKRLIHYSCIASCFLRVLPVATPVVSLTRSFKWSRYPVQYDILFAWRRLFDIFHGIAEDERRHEAISVGHF